MHKRNLSLFFCALFLCDEVVRAEAIELNSLHFENPPEWITQQALQKVVTQVERKLEWDIRKIQVRYIPDAEAFEKTHTMGKTVQAFTRTRTGEILLGPLVNTKNWQTVLRHELTHVVLLQKYKNAVPDWMVEGLANRVGGERRVDYAWLKEQNWKTVRTLIHPFSEKDQSKLHYQLSQAAVEFIESRCPLAELLQLSVGRSVEKYLKTFCRVESLDTELKAWISSRK